MKLFFFSPYFAAPVGALLTLAVLVPAAHAGGRSTVVHGSRGAVYQRHVNKTPGQFNASGSVTRPDGRTASRSINTQMTDAGRTTSARATGFNGRSTTYDSTRTRTDSGFERQVNTSGPNGGAGSKHVSVVRQGDTVSRTVTRTTTPAPQ